MRGFELVAPDVWRLSLLPFDGLNVYRVGTVLVDSGASITRRRLLSALEGIGLTAHAITHAHPDHQAASHAVCERFSLPFLCGSGDEEAAETGDVASLLPHPRSMIGLVARWTAGPGHPVSERLREGDSVADFRVMETPGHTPGHIALWRERDRVLVLGDVVFHAHPVTLQRGLSEPLRSVTWNPSLNRSSARRLAALEPAIVCFGHGAPLRDAAAFMQFAATLAE